MVLETTLERTYQSSWGIWEAVRELVCNAKDAETVIGARQEVEYDYTRQELIIKTHGAKIERSAMLMGTSGSREHETAIGRFGEGLPMSMLTIARSESYSMNITVGTESWTPKIAMSKQYGAEVLAISVALSKTPFDGVLVTIKGIPGSEWKEMKAKFLWLSPPHELMVVNTGAGSLLTHHSYRGLIYNRGVLVMTRSDLPYGFSLTLDVNRDRHLVDEFSLRYQVSRVLSHSLRARPTMLTEAVTDMLLSSSHEFVYYADEFDEDFKQQLADAIRSRYGLKSEPVANEQDASALRQLGLAVAVIPMNAYRLVERVFGSVQERIIRYTTSGITELAVSDLSGPRQENARRLYAMLPRLRNQLGDKKVVIARFKGPLRAHAADNTIFLNETSFDSLANVLADLFWIETPETHSVRLNTEITAACFFLALLESVEGPNSHNNASGDLSE